MTEKMREALETAVNRLDWCSSKFPAGGVEAEIVNDWVKEANASLAAAPQPAPADRESLMEVIDNALRDWSNLPPLTCLRASYVADALLARGLRLPAPETMAWAVVDPVAGVRSVFISNLAARRNAQNGDAIRRVELSWRVVEGGDDE